MAEMIRSLHAIGNPSGGTVALSSAAHYAAFIFQAIPGKTIDRICARCTASTSGVVDVRLETVSSAIPSNTLVAANTSLTGQSVAANTTYTWTLTSSYAVPTAATTVLAAVIRYSSGTSATFNLRYGNITETTQTQLPRTVENTGSDTQRTGSCSSLTVLYTDGTVQPLTMGISATSATAHGSTSTPDEYGNIITAPFNLKVIGLVATLRMASTSSVAQFRIYDADGSTVLTTDTECAFSGGAATSTSGTNTVSILFKDPIYIKGGATFYVSCRPTDTNQIYISTQTWFDAAHKAAIHDTISQVTRTDNGSWSTDTTKTVMISPIVDTSFSNRISVG